MLVTTTEKIVGILYLLGNHLHFFHALIMKNVTLFREGPQIPDLSYRCSKVQNVHSLPMHLPELCGPQVDASDMEAGTEEAMGPPASGRESPEPQLCRKPGETKC